MNIGEIAERFIRAAEVERAMPEHVGPAQPRSVDFGYVHDWIDKLGWAKSKGDKLKEDRLAEERRLFWERFGLRASASELAQLDRRREWLLLVPDEAERRALLAWSMAKAGGRKFNRWCFKVEHIHPETGRRRKNRALARISAHLARSDVQHIDNGHSGELPGTPEIDHIPDNIAEDAPEPNRSNSWADDAFRPFIKVYRKPYGKELDVPAQEFSWAAKRNERRRQREAKRRKKKPSRHSVEDRPLAAMPR
ncbi:MAG TPA: hypothetical protein VFT89_07405 [Rhizobiaceae bacterium]|nr:hypothetical protein [Rhizobiaceae bacterium]